MRARTALASGAAAAFLLAAGLAEAEHGTVTRYRGEYTFGHEVNVFCPAINSQCYWLSGETPGELRAALRQLSEEEAAAPYEPVCVVVEAIIDKDLPRTGFAADYDGLVMVSRVFGRCAETKIVTQGDLRHHRWILEAIDGEIVPSVELGSRLPELEFGENMRVAVNSGCSTIVGTGVLDEDNFVVAELVAMWSLCEPAQYRVELLMQTLLGSESIISLQADRTLVLESSAAQLHFRLQDWVD